MSLKGHLLLQGSVFDGEEDTMPLGRPEIWIRAHTIQYVPAKFLQ